MGFLIRTIGPYVLSLSFQHNNERFYPHQLFQAHQHHQGPNCNSFADLSLVVVVVALLNSGCCELARQNGNSNALQFLWPAGDVYSIQDASADGWVGVSAGCDHVIYLRWIRRSDVPGTPKRRAYIRVATAKTRLIIPTGGLDLPLIYPSISYSR